MKLGPKVKVGLGVFALLALLVGWQALSYWWNHGRSTGERTGIVRRVAVVGSPVCRYAEGELALIGGQPAQQVEIFSFGVESDKDSDPVLTQLRAAEKAGTRVTLHYRQDLKSWWRCTPHEYFITGVEK